MTKTVTSNYTSIAAPGNTFNARISADSDTFARNDIDALGNGLELHDHSSGKGLAVNSIPTGGLNIAAGLLTAAGGVSATAGNINIGLTTQYQIGGNNAIDVSGSFLRLNSASAFTSGVQVTPSGTDVYLAATTTLATTAVLGFPILPSMAGAPTGTPTNATAGRPMVLDSTNNKLWVYINGAWKGVVVA